MLSLIMLVASICDEITNPTIPIVKKALNLYFKYKEVINYLIVGGLTTLVSIGSYAIYRMFILSYVVCTILSWITAVLFAYITNRIFVFESKEKKVFIEFIKFIFCRLLTLGSELLTMWILVDLLSINDLIAKVVVQFIVVVLNYILSKLLVFRKNKIERR